MDEHDLSPEELIADMTPDEICELLSEMGIEADEQQAAVIQNLVAELGSLDAVLDALGDGAQGDGALGEEEDRAAA